MKTAMSRRKRLTITAIVTTAIVIGGGGAAYAFWSSSGTGTGKTVTGTSVLFTVTSAAATGDALSPGGPTATVPFTVQNPGTGSQFLSKVVVTVANSDGSAWIPKSACSAADYTVSAPIITPVEIAPGKSFEGTVEVTMNDLGTNQDGCEGISVPLFFAAS